MPLHNMPHQEEIEALEAPFVAQTFPYEESFRLIPGDLPVVVSAPHSVTQTRLGKPKQGEYRTGALALLLQRQLGCSAIVKTRNDHDDANYDEFSVYKDALIELIESRSIRYLLDLHIMSPKRDYDVDLGTGYGNNVNFNRSLVQSIVSLFKEAGIENVKVDHLFSASYPYTVSSAVHRACGIPCFQLELNWRLLDMGGGVASIHRVYSVLGEVIHLLLKDVEESS